MTKIVDVTGLNPQQIAIIEEIVTALKIASKVEPVNEPFKNKSDTEDEQLEKLHKQFSWLVADLGVKEPLENSK